MLLMAEVEAALSSPARADEIISVAEACERAGQLGYSLNPTEVNRAMEKGEIRGEQVRQGRTKRIVSWESVCRWLVEQKKPRKDEDTEEPNQAARAAIEARKAAAHHLKRAGRQDD
jgi:hypothetical protein